MRLPFALLAALVCASTASAQAQESASADVTPVPATTTVSASAENSAASADPPTPAAHHVRLTWEQRFAQANTTQDGHLTLDQAKAGYRTVARHFHDIDLDAKGYVTEDDVRAWHKAQRAAHHPAKAHDSATLQPQHAFQRMFPSDLQMNTATERTVPHTERRPAITSPAEIAPTPASSPDSPS